MTSDGTRSTHGRVELDDDGSVTLPKELRFDLGLDAGSTFTVVRTNETIHLVPTLSETRGLSAGKSREQWVGDAFRDTGDATFRDP